MAEKNETRDKTVAFLVTAEEKEAIEQMARDERRSVSNFVHGVVMGSIGRVESARPLRRTIQRTQSTPAG